MLQNATGAIAEFVVPDQQPVNVVEAPSLANLLRVTSNDSAFVIPSRPIVTRTVGAIKVYAANTLTKLMKGYKAGTDHQCTDHKSVVSAGLAPFTSLVSAFAA